MSSSIFLVGDTTAEIAEARATISSHKGSISRTNQQIVELERLARNHLNNLNMQTTAAERIDRKREYAAELQGHIVKLNEEISEMTEFANRVSVELKTNTPIREFPQGVDQIVIDYLN